MMFLLFFDYNKKLFQDSPEDFIRIMNGKCDFEELDDKYHIELEVPGIKRNEIEITLNNDSTQNCMVPEKGE